MEREKKESLKATKMISETIKKQATKKRILGK